MSELIFLGVLALIIIGPKELPGLARTIGRFINELKRSTNDLSQELKEQAGLDRLDKVNLFEDDRSNHHEEQTAYGAEDPHRKGEDNLARSQGQSDSGEQLEFNNLRKSSEDGERS